MTVRVYVEDVVYDERTFDDEQKAIDFASVQQDIGFKVRFIEE